MNAEWPIISAGGEGDAVLGKGFHFLAISNLTAGVELVIFLVQVLLPSR